LHFHANHKKASPRFFQNDTLFILTPQLVEHEQHGTHLDQIPKRGHLYIALQVILSKATHNIRATNV
jgi:hypothetical protein